MIKIRKAKIAALTVGMTLALGAAASPAAAQTIAELQAQINALMAQLAALQGGSSAPAATFTQNLTLGSTGSEVSSLQQALVAQGHLTMPAGVAYGYFGPLTQAAVAKWQAANGVSPTAGYWGPISRARYAALAGPSMPGPSATPAAGITTPGVEGTITVTKDPSPASGAKVYEGDTKANVLGIEIEAKLSDMKVERVKLDLDETGDTATSDSAFYNKFAKKIYVLDGSTVLASADLNKSTVVEESNEISITLAGMSIVVPKDTKKVLTVAVDAQASWDSTYDNDTWTVGVPVDGVRAIDGAGVNQYGPSTAFSNSVTSTGDVVDSATLTLSLNSGSPKAAEVICTKGTDEDECDELEVLRFNALAEDDAVTITDLVIDLVRGGNTSTATSSTAYLYNGSTLVDSATVAGTSATAMTATFDDFDYVVAKDSTAVLTVKLDIDDSGTAATTFVASFDAADVTAENSRGDGLTESGSADAETVTIRKVGLEASLDGAPTILKGETPVSSNTSTSTALATFNLRVKAVGGDIRLGTNASTTGAFVENDGNGASATAASFLVYRGGTNVTATVSTNASTTGFTVPTTGTTAEGTNSRILSENSEVTFPVTFQFEGRTAAGALITAGSYSVQLGQLNWVSSAGLQSSTFMADDLGWRTSSVSLP